MFKKVNIIVLFFVLVMILVFAGCTKDDSGNPKATDTSTNAPEETAKPAEATAEPRPEISLSIGIAGFTSFDDAVADVIQKKFNIKVTPVDLSADGKLDLLAASGELPDLVQMNITIPNLKAWKDQQLLRDIPEDMLNNFPTLKAMLDKSPIYQAYKQAGKGHFIPVPMSIENHLVASSQAIYFREDWRKNLNIAKDPETLDELYTALKAFTFDDPDGNGKKDTYGVCGKIFSTHLLPWGMDTDAWTQEDGKWIPGILSKNTLPALKFYNKLYADKILDPEFAATSGDKLIEKFAKGGCGMMVRGADPYWTMETIGKSFKAGNPQIANPLEAVTFLPPFKVDASSKPYWNKSVDSYGTVFSSKVDDNKLKRALELIEFLDTPEGMKLLSFGIEGTDYKVENGKIVSTISGPVRDKYKSLAISGIGNWGYDWMMDPMNASVPDEYKQLEQRRADSYNPAAENMNTNWNIVFMSTPAKEEFKIDFDADIAKIIMSKDVEAEYNKLVKKLNDVQGVAKVIDEMNQKAQAEGIK